MEIKNKLQTKNWEEFFNKAQDLCIKNPTTTRYVVKYRSKENIAVIKVTSGSVVIKYKTANPEDNNKVEEMNKFFLSYASCVKEEKGILS